jgi:hypothetical protein
MFFTPTFTLIRIDNFAKPLYMYLYPIYKILKPIYFYLFDTFLKKKQCLPLIV